jgi:hypothetical protein
MRRPLAATLGGMGASTRAGGSGCQPTEARGVQARARTMAGVRWSATMGAERVAAVLARVGYSEKVLRLAARPLFLGVAVEDEGWRARFVDVRVACDGWHRVRAKRRRGAMGGREGTGEYRVRAEDVGGDGGGARWSTVGVSQGARRKQGGILMSREWKRATPAPVQQQFGWGLRRANPHSSADGSSKYMCAPYRNNGGSSHTLHSTCINIGSGSIYSALRHRCQE